MEQTLLLLNFEKTLQLCVESFLGVHSLLVTLYDKFFPLIKKITVKSFQQYLFGLLQVVAMSGLHATLQD